MRLLPPSVALLFACLPAMAGEPFGIQVLDETTGRGVPMVTLETVNGIRLVTDSAGWAAFDEPGLMRQRVFFQISSPGYAFPKDPYGETGFALETKPGGSAEIKMLRLNVAERLYRLTGQGIYRDSTLLKKEEPLPSPNQAGGVLAQGDAQTALFRGQLFWTWGETRRAVHPQNLLPGTSATSSLPTASGLDPTQGVHFQYAGEKDGSLIPVLQCKEPGGIRLEGLLPVKDAAGQEHLIARYVRSAPDGNRLEHGIAELGESRQFERMVVLGDDYAWQFPQGNAIRVAEEGLDHYYFATPFPYVRVPASYDALFTPSNYEALAWDDDAKEVRWQKAAPPMTPADEARWIEKRMVSAKGARCQLQASAGSKAPPVPAGGSVVWNAFRKAWVMLFATASGEVYCAQSPKIDGPWQKAVLVASHPGCSFTSVSQVAALDQEDGRLLYFQGTLASQDVKVPRYDGNALMYRLDLNDTRLAR